ncbi:Digalactosyldiacylglycerol synthase 1, chloroplastic [Glycine soja]
MVSTGSPLSSLKEHEAYIRRWLEEKIGFKADFNISFFLGKVLRLLATTSGIRITVSNLHDYHSARLQDRARTLFDSWKGVGNGDTESHEVEVAKVDNASDTIVSEERQPSASNEAGNDNGCL